MFETFCRQNLSNEVSKDYVIQLNVSIIYL